jgi:mannosyltransferase
MGDLFPPRRTKLRRYFRPPMFFATLVLASFLRLRALGHDSLWLDEAVSWSQSRYDLWHLIETTASDNYPPLHNLVLFAMIHAFGDSEVVLRLPSAIFGVANVAAIYWLGIILNDRPAGLLAALLLAVSAFHIWYSQEARMYALLALSATLFVATSVRYIQLPTPYNTIGSAAAGLALLYSHPYGALTWVCIAVAVLAIILVAPEGIHASGSQWLIVQGLGAAAFLPWAFILLQRAKLVADTGFWLPEPSWTFVVRELSSLISDTRLAVLLLVGSLAAILPQATKFKWANQSVINLVSRIGLLFVWLIKPFFLGLGASFLLLCSVGLTTQRTKAASRGALILIKSIFQRPPTNWANSIFFF